MRLENVLDQMAHNAEGPFVLRHSNAPVLSMFDWSTDVFLTSRPSVGGAKKALSTTPSLLAEVLLKAKCAVALTGSGISAESGLRTRQDLWSDPLWSRDRCVSVTGFHREPADLWRLVQSFLSDVSNFTPAPNRSHAALAQLEAAGVLRGVITQNVDELHQKAGTNEVVELHGSLSRVVCRSCNTHHGSCADVLAKREKSDSPLDPLPPRCPG
jgi:NAD-dependent deacetylase